MMRTLGQFDPYDHYVRVGETVVEAMLLERTLLFCQTLVMLTATALRRARVSYTHEIGEAVPRHLSEDNGINDLRETLLECERRLRRQATMFLLHIPGIPTPTVFADEVPRLLQSVQLALELHAPSLCGDAVTALRTSCADERALLDALTDRARASLDRIQQDDPFFGGGGFSRYATAYAS